jgi:hypothetical protein
MTVDRGPAPARRARNASRFVFTFLMVVVLGACARETERKGGSEMAGFREVPDSAWAALAHKRVFFGHQSVGWNIMEGVAELERERPALGLRVVQGDSAADGRPAFAHTPIGRNGDPGGKSDAFAARIEGGLGERVDIALHKYCFADIGSGTRIETVFDHYRSTMARLRAEYPEVVFVHVTAPLVTARSGGLKLAVQRLIGRAPTRVGSNIARERFNDLMRKEYAGREPLFDLATLESTRPDGRREGVAFAGRPGYSLDPDYSSDGSHLNEVGRRRIAEALLVFLAELPASGRSTAASR